MSKGEILNPFQHALKRPDLYIGSVATKKEYVWVYDEENECGIQKLINYNPGLFNIVREILSNAIDNVWRSERKNISMKRIEIKIDRENGMISVKNDGYCIPVVQKKYKYTNPRTGEITKEVLYPAEIFFGDMFSGTNYNDNEIRKTSGRNGVGAKAANIFSKEFTVRCTNPKHKSGFVQTYRNNGKERETPQVTSFRNKNGFTEIEFIPDYKYFKYPEKGNEGIDDDFVSLIKLYAHEVAMITGVLVKFDDGEVTNIKISSLEKYAKLFYPDITAKNSIFLKSPNGDDCLIVCSGESDMDTQDNIHNISFVNGIHTKNGGIHVDAWRDSIVSTFVRTFNSRKPAKGEKVAPKATSKEVYPYLCMFLKAEVDKPKFSTQTKDELSELFNDKEESINYRLFDPRKKAEKDEWSRNLDLCIKKMMKWDFVILLEDKLSAKIDRALSKKEKVTKKRITIGSKADDANKAGTKDSLRCTLYITEGLSAKAFAVRGIGSILPDGRDYNGAFAIKGKFINVQNHTKAKINSNEEILLLKKILGLRHGVDYSKDENIKTLRYGNICILTDADDDGIHIRGLLLNYFYIEFPGLIERGLVTSLSTAVVSVDGKKSFYSYSSFKEWHENANLPSKVDIKYYKGLGSINPKDAPAYFNKPKKVSYYFDGEERDYMDLGFNDEYSDDRKLWIVRDATSSDFFMDEDRESNLINNFTYKGPLSLSTFVDQQLIIYHIMTLRRALPNIWDGLKESQRKIIYTLMTKKYKKTKDLEKIMGAVKEETGYHHGGKSLQDTIIGMAQGFVGSNNIPMCENDGEVGCLDPLTPVLMWSGEIKLAYEVVVGDYLAGDDGYPRTVQMLVSGRDKMYRVKQSRGKEYVVNSRHILTLKYGKHKTISHDRREWIVTFSNPRKRSIEFETFDRSSEAIDFKNSIPNSWEIFDIEVQTYLGLPKNIKKNLFAAKNTCCLDWPINKVGVDPYQLGKALGININVEIDIRPYIYNCERIRKEFLVGFIDGAGQISHNDGSDKLVCSVEIDGNTRILHDINYICGTLGIESVIKNKERDDKHFMDLEIYGFELMTLRSRVFGDGLWGCVKSKNIEIEIEECGYGNYVGWHIDGNERFLLDDFTITHNTRAEGGKDAAAGRYVCTNLCKIMYTIFPSEDLCLFKKVVEDGIEREWEYLMGIIPMILVNGAKGTASGYATDIPCYNPEDLVYWIECWLDDTNSVNDLDMLKPWYRNYKGEINIVDNGDKSPKNWTSRGILEKSIKKGEVGWWHIKELSIGVWTSDFRGWLGYLESGSDGTKKNKKKTQQVISEIKDYSTANEVHFVIKPTKDFIPDIDTPGNMKGYLNKTHSLNNMIAIDEFNYPRKFDTPEDILKFYCPHRLSLYGERKQYQTKEIERDLLKTSNKYIFVKGVVDKKLDLYKTNYELEQIMEKNPWEFDRMGKNNSYDYLLNMQMRSMTVEKLEELKKEIQTLKKKLKELKNKSCKDIWREELNKFKVEYKKFLSKRID